MKLNDLSRPRNEHHTPFGDARGMAELCHYVWKHFFWHALPGEPLIDVAIWEIASTVSLRPASTEIDEANRKFQRSAHFHFKVRGYAQILSRIERQKNADAATIHAERIQLQQQLIHQLQRAIIKGFNIASVKKSFQKFNPAGQPFTILTTTKDDGLHANVCIPVFQLNLRDFRISRGIAVKPDFRVTFVVQLFALELRQFLTGILVGSCCGISSPVVSGILICHSALVRLSNLSRAPLMTANRDANNKERKIRF